VHNGGMTTTAILTVNLILTVLVLAAVAAVVYLAHHLPSSAPRSDDSWGTGGDPWVASDPLPLRQLADHEARRAAA